MNCLRMEKLMGVSTKMNGIGCVSATVSIAQAGGGEND